MSVDLIFRIAAIGIVVAVLSQLLSKSGRDDMATMVAIAGLVIVLVMVIGVISDLFESVKNVFNLY
ncbi:MAG: stage III sporulation protein AC [Christensenellales bacterium]|nr:stage III sporulation protein AC [Clostridiales bacterium]MBS6942677.1 stage III sporulation protein AC [Clostridiales bacterium]